MSSSWWGFVPLYIFLTIIAGGYAILRWWWHAYVWNFSVVRYFVLPTAALVAATLIAVLHMAARGVPLCPALLIMVVATVPVLQREIFPSKCTG